MADIRDMPDGTAILKGVEISVEYGAVHIWGVEKDARNGIFKTFMAGEGGPGFSMYLHSEPYEEREAVLKEFRSRDPRELTRTP